MTPTTSETTRARRVWEILEQAGVSTSTIGWYSTWPLREDFPGIVISDRAIYRQAESIRPPGVVDFGRLLFEAFRSAQLRLSEDRQDEGVRSNDWRDSESLQTYLTEYAFDIAKSRAAEQILREHAPDFTAVYLNLIDVAQHKLWRYYEPEAFGAELSPDEEHLSKLIPEAYVLMDELLGDLMRAAGEDVTVVVLSDHGGGPWVTTGLKGFVGSAFHKRYHPDYSGNHRLNGIWVMGGPNFHGATDIGDVRQIDVVPSLLKFYGLPLADDMPGEPVLATSVLLELDSAHRTPTYEIGALYEAGRPRTSDVDGDIRRKLEALGYIE
jgi:predicted AlkP superfamily phosphohydrolase/phosphomutase